MKVPTWMKAPHSGILVAQEALHPEDALLGSIQTLLYEQSQPHFLDNEQPWKMLYTLWPSNLSFKIYLEEHILGVSSYDLCGKIFI